MSISLTVDVEPAMLAAESESPTTTMSTFGPVASTGALASSAKAGALAFAGAAAATVTEASAKAIFAQVLNNVIISPH
ncbi:MULTISPECIES: hypothetical protein [unclassified Novosphingobium]|uniref:hypothetical protein n=1 Tax=unclassified Novosphingobium TaxID=2644732 RepID=UPI0025EBEA8D|nr:MULTISPECIES: hypothetical protein [unclassified Novosphingobium]